MRRMRMGKWRLAVAVLLAALSIGVAWELRKAAFPVVGADFAIGRDDVSKRMAEVLGGLGYEVKGSRRAVSFGESTAEMNYVELVAGTERLEALGGEGLSIWYWVGRWFQPGEWEETTVWLNPRGELTGLWRTLEEEHELPSASRAGALALAEEFLAEWVTQHPQMGLELVSESANRLENRVDWSFTWEREALRVGEAPFQLTVTVQGNEIGGYGEGLEIPEGWTREFERKREVNELCETVAGYGFFAVMIGLLIDFILRIRRGGVRWRGVVPWGWLAVVAVVSLAVEINGFPDAVFGYDTLQNWNSFLVETGINAMRNALFGAVGLWLIFVMADGVYRDGLPGTPPMHWILGRGAISDPWVNRGIGVGILAAMISLGYVTIFYVVGRWVGVWCPVDLDAAEIFTGWLPWMQPAEVGLSASFGEELLFRVVALLLIWRLTRVRWVGVVGSALVWAFLHSTYPQMPGYVRGLELTVVGIAWGILFLRYGLISTLTAHYLYNCWIGSVVVFASDSWLNRLGALAVSLWPVGIFVWGWLRRKKAEGWKEETIGGSGAGVVSGMRSVVLPGCRVFSGWGLVGVGIFCAGALAMMWLVPLPQAAMGRFGEHGLSRAEIVVAADTVMRERGKDPTIYRRLVSSSRKSIPTPAYLLEHRGLAELADLFGSEWPDVVWNVRYFRELDPNQFFLQFDKTGRMVRWRHKVLREAVGAELERADALVLAEAELAGMHGVDLAREELTSEEFTQRENRRDFDFVFERKDFGWGEAKLRTGITIQGDEPVSFWKSVRVPEAWRLERSESGWQQLITAEVGTAVELLQGVGMLVLAVLLIGRRLVPWRVAFVGGLVPLGLEMIDGANGLPWFLSGYDTAKPLLGFLLREVGSSVTEAVMAYLGGVLTVGMGLGFLRWGFGLRWRELLRGPSGAGGRGRSVVNFVLIIAGSVLAFELLGFLRNLVAGHLLPSWVAHYGSWSVRESVLWLDGLVGALRSGFDSTMGTAMWFGVLGVVWRRSWVAAVLLGCFYPLIEAIGAGSWAEFGYRLVSEEAEWLLLVGLVVLVWRADGVLVFLVYFLKSLAGYVESLWENGGPAYQGDAWVLAGIGVAVLASAIWWRRREWCGRELESERERVIG